MAAGLTMGGVKGNAAAAVNARGVTMSGAQQALRFGGPLTISQSRRPPQRFSLQKSDNAWAIAFVVPYVDVFALLVIYPVIYGLRIGSDPTPVPRVVR